MSDDVTRLPGSEYRKPIVQPLVEHVLEPLVTKDGYGRPFCGHGHIGIESDRRVFCKDCDAYIDPVDYILELAKWWDRYRSSMREAQRLTRQYEERAVVAKRAEKNARARLRKLEAPEVKQLRQTLAKAGTRLWRIQTALEALGVGGEDLILRDLLEVGSALRVAAERLGPETRPVPGVAC